MQRTRPRQRSVLRGMILLARGKASGLLEFGNSPEALTASLAPLIAFPLVGAAMIAVGGDPWHAALGFLSRLCVVVALPLLIQGFARLTKREDDWFRTATALNWAFWVVIPAMLVAAFLGVLLTLTGLSQNRAEYAVLAILGLYMLWLNWFIIRVGLRLKTLVALAFVIASNATLALLTFGPDLLTRALGK